MRAPLLLASVACSALLVAGCGGGSSGGGGGAASTTAPATSATPTPIGSSSSAPVATSATPASTAPVATFVAAGTIKFLTYNVAGLPQFISQVQPARNIPLISPLLNNYELVVVQEDFWYHSVLTAQARHPWKSVPLVQYYTLVGDGLNTFSQTRFFDFERRKWNDFHGIVNHSNDGLSSKGFSACRHDVGNGVMIDVYNLHADAGNDPGDEAARTKNFQQLLAFMQTYSTTNPVIVAGDTNLSANRPADMAVLSDFLGRAGLRDAARVLGKHEVLDRVMVRGTADVTLDPVLWRDADEFNDSNGQPLSDHSAIHVDVRWVKVR